MVYPYSAPANDKTDATTTPTDLDRFAAKIEFGDDGCWLWTAGSFSGSGYACFRVAGRTVHGHRWGYEMLVGLVPDGLELDHLCRVRHCVNPDHLEPVTHAENMRRAVAVKTHCAAGHQWVPANIYTDKRGWHRCLLCHRRRSREDQRRRRAA